MTETAVLTGPLSFGQLSVWRDIEELPPDGQHQANLVFQQSLAGAGVPVPQVVAAVDLLRERHESLRTVFDLTDPAAPVQVVRPATQVAPPVTTVTPDPGADAAATAARLAEELEHRAFDLAAEEPLRVIVVEVGGHAEHLVLGLHHIAVDMWAVEVLRAEFSALLSGSILAAGGTSPRELAVVQHSPGWAERRSSTRDYLHGVYAEVARSAGQASRLPLQPVTKAKANLSSRVAWPAALERAAELGISPPGLVLAAYCWQAHELTGADRILVNTMTTNRLFPGTAGLISSMNQWARLMSEREPGEGFAAFAHRLHWSALRAYRHGCYDVDDDNALRAEVERAIGPVTPEFSYNFVDLPDDGTAPPEDAAAPAYDLTSMPPVYVGGPMFYLVATHGSHFDLTARTRIATCGQDQLGAFLVGVHQTLAG